MKENVLDVLLFLFEHYMDEDTETSPDKTELSDELTQAGFEPSDINKAFSWLDGLSNLQDSQQNQSVQNTKSIRIYSELEKKKFSRDAIGFLIFLDNIGAFENSIREMIIDRAMALESPEIELEDLKWVMLLVLFNQPGQEAAFAWVEDVVLQESLSSIH
jgi:Smg protein